MSAKVIWYRDAWWLRVHHADRKKERRFGPSKDDRRRAEAVARKLNARLELGTFQLAEPETNALPCDAELLRWLEIHRPTLKATTAVLDAGLIKNHLAPHFGARDLREIQESDLLQYVAAMQAKGLAPGTIKNSLGLLRRVYYALITDGRLDKNPARNLGRMMRRVQNAAAKETALREAWTHAEAATLIDLARAHEARFAPFLELLFATGLRRGEALGLQWSDISFDERTLTVRRSITSQGVSTPKSGRSRRVVMTESLAETLFDVLADRQRERLALGWPETPAWVFCTESGTAPDPRNAARIWERVRRRAQKEGVRGLPLHSARHSWATWALQARKPVRWVADQLGHADASTTLNHYAHAMPEDEADLSFLDLDVAGRRYPSPDEDTDRNKAPNPAKEWRARHDSNMRPSAPQADALSI